MGLDMFARTKPTAAAPAQPVDFDREGAELHYWRKHPDLHGWMEQLYRRKGGGAESFNLAAVALDLADLTELEAAVQGGTLPETHGFFFGESDGSERDDDLVFIAKARAAIARGETVFYSSWW